ncbi:MAG: hypothetical protein K0R50_4328 [Eubacterium sp.]|nr:hypothetical protein [Eubacterium sp.]
MKFTTFYFSGTGNTKWAAEEFNKIVIEKLHISELISIDSLENNDFSFFIDIWWKYSAYYADIY